jgi:uncharacterized protein (DUF983 family)
VKNKMGRWKEKEAEQLVRNRARFEHVLKDVRCRCPKDEGKLFEINMPYVVCEKCATKYVLAVEPRGFLPQFKLEFKLIEEK